MEKIPTMFKRNPENMSEILNEPHPECLWVFEGKGEATQKYDGTCVLITATGGYFKRREVKKGKKRPENFVEISTDENTGKTVGWVPVNTDDPQDKWHMEGLRNSWHVPPGTYELCGPKINGNPEKFEQHVLVSHETAKIFKDAPRNFDLLKGWLRDKDIEGLVFHNPDGRMCKIKKRDFGLKR